MRGRPGRHARLRVLLAREGHLGEPTAFTTPFPPRHLPRCARETGRGLTDIAMKANRQSLKPSITIDSTTKEIRSEVALRGGAEPIVLNYRLSLQGDDWKVTNVGVMGVWLVATY